MKIAILVITLFVISCAAAVTGIDGEWEGESLCTIKDSPCHDEHVIYTLSSPDSGGKLTIRADKVVGGKREDMGTLDCTYDKKTSKIKCSMERGDWAFTVNGNSIKGSLTLKDGSLFRNISVTKKL
jgi:hypothetical protein